MKTKHTEEQYKTLAELKAAYESGELDREKSPLMLDNDNSAVYADDADDPEWSVCVYSGPGGDVLIEEALALLDIPSDHV